MSKLFIFWMIAMLAIVVFITASFCNADTGTASWYSVESCKREGTWQKYGGKTASGEVFDNDKLTCASWFYNFGHVLRVTNLETGRSVDVVVTDRGPSKRLVRKGRIIDLSKMAFSRIGKLSQGVILVRVEVINGK